MILLKVNNNYLNNIYIMSKLNLISSSKAQDLINKELKQELLQTKDKINQYYNIKKWVNNNYQTSKWEYYRSLLNKYETISKGKGKINRAYFKLKELMLDEKEKYTKIKKVAALAEGPGGFIQFITDYYPTAEVYGITLKYESDSRNMRDFDSSKVKIIYGEEGNPTHDGNLYNEAVVNGFAKRVGEVDLVTADGGFEAKDENNKEVEHLKLFLAETLTAFKVLKKGGSFILKIYDIFTKPTLELLFLLSSTFKSVEIKKPVSSRPANSERYVVCHGFKGYNAKMHVNNEEEYSSILDLSEADKKRFEKFIYNLGLKNAEYVKTIMENINEVVNYIEVNEKNGLEEINKKKEREIYRQVWEKVYEKKERKSKREAKKAKKEASKKGLNVDAAEFVL